MIIITNSKLLSNMKKLELSILDAIKQISENTTDNVSFDVHHMIEKQPFKKGGKLKTIVNIVITKNI